MRTILEQVVIRAIRNFQKQHPQTRVTSEASGLLLNHARKHRKETMAHLRAGKVSKRQLTKGLEDVLAYAEEFERQHRVGEIYAERSQAYGRSGGRAYVYIGGRAYRENSRRTGRSELAREVVRMAMKKKCGTFPWC